MKININIDDPTLIDYSIEKNLPIFEIWWEHNERHYPMKNWSDFGIVILGFWIGTFIELLEEGKETEFTFMDGPYSIKAQYELENGMVKLSLQGLDIIWNCSLIKLIEEVAGAVNKIYEELKRRGAREKDRAALEKGAAILKECLSKAKAGINKADRSKKL